MDGRRLVPAVIAAVAAAPLAFTLSAGPARAGSAEVLACVEIQDTQARLACYDRTVPSLRGAAPAAQAPEPVRDPVGEFGRERTEAGRRDAEETQVQSIQAGVRAARQLQPGRYILSLDNGQVWYVKDAGSRRLDAGDRVEIKRALVDGYAMVVNGTGRIIRVERVD